MILKNISRLFVGYAVSQGVLLAATPLLTRIYSVEDFSYFSYLVAFTMIFLAFSSLQYEYVIPLIKFKKVRLKLLQLTMCIVLISSLVTMLIFLLCEKHFLHLSLSLVLLFMCYVVLILQGFLQIYSLFLISENLTQSIAYGKLIQNIAMVVFQLSLPWFFKLKSENILIGGLLFGLFINFMYFFWLKNKCKKKVSFISKREILYLLIRYKNFPTYTVIANLSETLSTVMPILLLGSIYGKKALGLYFLVFRVFSAPVNLVVQTLSKVMLSVFSECIKKNEKILPLFIKISFFLSLLGVVYYIVLYNVANIAPYLFGGKWAETKIVLQILSPAIVLILVVSPLSPLFLLLECNRTDLFCQLGYIALTAGSFYFFHRLSFFCMLHYLVISWILFYFAYWSVLLKIVIKRDRKICVV